MLQTTPTKLIKRITLMKPASTAPACPCGRLGAQKKPLAFAQCCGRYLDDFAATPAPDAESLMRSRYSAFVQERADYLLATWHVSTRPDTLDFEPGAKWLGLDVRAHRLLDAQHAEVEFVARCRSAGRATRLHERSRFVYEGGRWFYVDGDQF
jgi:SEC-C motif-containing protein